jgi:hypothetical protein
MNEDEKDQRVEGISPKVLKMPCNSAPWGIQLKQPTFLDDPENAR